MIISFIADVVLIIILIFTILVFLSGIVGLWLRVPFVPSNSGSIKTLDEIHFKGNEKVCDLGSGSGTALFYLRKKHPHLQLTGYELAILPYLYAKIKNAIYKSNIDFKLQNFFHADLNQYDMFFCYLMPSVLEKSIQKLQTLDNPVTVISNAFSSNLIKPEQEIPIPGQKTKLFVYKLKGKK